MHFPSPQRKSATEQNGTGRSIHPPISHSPNGKYEYLAYHPVFFKKCSLSDFHYPLTPKRNIQCCILLLFALEVFFFNFRRDIQRYEALSFQDGEATKFFSTIVRRQKLELWGRTTRWGISSFGSVGIRPGWTRKLETCNPRHPVLKYN